MATNAIFDMDDRPLTISPNPVSHSSQASIPALLDDSIKMPSAMGAGGRGGRGASGRVPRQIQDTHSSSEFPILDKALRGCKDPTVAGPKIRKVTLKEFGCLEVKATKATALCKDVLNMIHDDFENDDPCLTTCVFLRVGAMCQSERVCRV